MSFEEFYPHALGKKCPQGIHRILLTAGDHKRPMCRDRHPENIYLRLLYQYQKKKSFMWFFSSPLRTHLSEQRWANLEWISSSSSGSATYSPRTLPSTTWTFHNSWSTFSMTISRTLYWFGSGPSPAPCKASGGWASAGKRLNKQKI